MTTAPLLVDVADDRYFDVEGLAHYSGLSVKTIRRYMKDPVNPLPNHHVRGSGQAHGRVLISKREFDAWVAAFPPLVKPRARTRSMGERVAAAVARSRGRTDV